MEKRLRVQPATVQNLFERERKDVHDGKACKVLRRSEKRRGGQKKREARRRFRVPRKRRSLKDVETDVAQEQHG